MRRVSKSDKKAKALAHIEHLLKEADKAFSKRPDLAHKYAKEIRKSAMKVNLTLPKEIKRRVCRKCEHFLVPGKNLRVRTRKSHMVMKCGDCGNISRYGYLREKKHKI